MTKKPDGNQQQNLSGATLARNTLLNLIGQVAPMMAALFAIPLLIRGLGTDRFGVLSLVWVVIGYFSLFDLGLGRALTQLVAEKLGTGNKEEIPALVWTSLLLLLVLGIVGLFVLGLLSPSLVNHFLRIPVELRPETLKSLYLLSAAIPVIVVTSGFRGVLEAQQCFGVLNLMRIPYGIFTFVSPLLVTPFSYSLYPIVIIAVVGRVIYCLAHVYFCLRELPALHQKIIIERQVITPLLRFGGWMTVTNIIGPLMVYLDRFFIGVIISVTAVAYYSTPFEVVTKFWVIPGALVGVLFPTFATSFVRDVNYTTTVFSRGVKYVYLAVFPVTVILVTLGSEGLHYWVGEEYAQNSTRVLQILAIGLLINSTAQVPFALIQGIGRPDLTAKLHLLELPLYLLTLWFFGLRWGIDGVAVVWLARVILDTLLLFILASRYVTKTVRYLRPVGLIIITTLMTLTIALIIQGIFLKAVFLILTLLGFTIVTWSRGLTLTEQVVVCDFFKRINALLQRGLLA